ncbi:MAG TPA: phosphate ABC transporter permease PstA [Acidimicrobiales bacterium]|nr:phosphate ABC transporter permease PstA [Acidimicrobiales bacterium]
MSVLSHPGNVAPLTREAVSQRLSGQQRDVPNLAFRIGLLATLVLTLAIVVVLVASILGDGLDVLTDRGLEFLTVGNSGDAAEAGMWQAIYGSAWIAAFVAGIAFPLGIAAAVYLEEYARDTFLTRLITVNIRNLAGVPSIVYGILGLSIFVKALDGVTGGRSIVAGGLTLAVLVLPIVIITASEALRAVPDSIREAGFGVGAGRWEVTRAHVLPYAAPGILTGTVLALARALGEAAPLILVGASVGFFNTAEGTGLIDRIQGTFTALPNLTYGWARQPGDDWQANTSAAILVMLVVIFTFNAAAILLRNRYDRARDY